MSQPASINNTRRGMYQHSIYIYNRPSEAAQRTRASLLHHQVSICCCVPEGWSGCVTDSILPWEQRGVGLGVEGVTGTRLSPCLLGRLPVRLENAPVRRSDRWPAQIHHDGTQHKHRTYTHTHSLKHTHTNIWKCLHNKGHVCMLPNGPAGCILYLVTTYSHTTCTLSHNTKHEHNIQSYGIYTQLLEIWQQIMTDLINKLHMWWRDEINVEMLLLWYFSFWAQTS